MINFDAFKFISQCNIIWLPHFIVIQQNNDDTEIRFCGINKWDIFLKQAANTSWRQLFLRMNGNKHFCHTKVVRKIYKRSYACRKVFPSSPPPLPPPLPLEPKKTTKLPSYVKKLKKKRTEVILYVMGRFMLKRKNTQRDAQ